VLRDAGEPRPPATSCTGHVYALLPRRAVPSGTSSLRPLASQRCKQLNAVWFTVLAFLVGSERAAALCVHVPAIAALDAFLNERTPRVGHGVSKRPGFETLRLARKGSRSRAMRCVICLDSTVSHTSEKRRRHASGEKLPALTCCKRPSRVEARR
jgi:hypothetical protein